MVARQDGPPDRAFVQPMSIPLWWYRPATSLRRPVDVVQKVGSCKGGSWPWKGIYVEMNMKRGWEEWKGDIWHFHETIVPQEIGLFCLHLPPSSIVQYALQYPKCLRLCMNAWHILADLPCWPSLLRPAILFWFHGVGGKRERGTRDGGSWQEAMGNDS